MGGGDERLGRGTPPTSEEPQERTHTRTSWRKGLLPTPAPSKWPPHPRESPPACTGRSGGLRHWLMEELQSPSKGPSQVPAPSALCTSTGARPTDCLSPRKAQTQMGPVLLRSLLPKVPVPVSPSRPQLGRSGGFSFPLAAL